MRVWPPTRPEFTCSGGPAQAFDIMVLSAGARAGQAKNLTGPGRSVMNPDFSRLPRMRGVLGRVAQRESTPFTREGSQVQSLSRPPAFALRATARQASLGAKRRGWL